MKPPWISLPLCCSYSPLLPLAKIYAACPLWASSVTAPQQRSQQSIDRPSFKLPSEGSIKRGQRQKRNRWFNNTYCSSQGNPDNNSPALQALFKMLFPPTSSDGSSDPPQLCAEALNREHQVPRTPLKITQHSGQTSEDSHQHHTCLHIRTGLAFAISFRAVKPSK